MEGKKKKIRIKDIAELANVSVGTVDRVLHNRGDVNAEKRARVMKIIDELSYTPNLLARSLASKKIIRIAVLIPEPDDRNNLYWEKPLVGVQMAIKDLGDYHVDIKILTFNTADEKSFIDQSDFILREKYDGIVFAPAFHGPSMSLVEKCNENRIPVIFMDSTMEDVEVRSYFGQDAEQSGRLAARLMYYGVQNDAKVLILNIANKMAITRHLKKREKGFLDYFNNLTGSQGIKALSVEIDITGKQEPERSLAKIIAAHPDTEGIFVTNARVHQVAKFICRNNLSGLFLGGYDLVGPNLKYLKKGVIDFLICQKPEDQGYKSLMAMFNHILTGMPVKRINYSPIDIVMKENVDYYISTPGPAS
jgi:LacI family transcriptional regulator